MTEQEPAAQPRTTIARFIVGVTPALTAALLLTAHIRQPIASENAGALLAACITLVCASLAIGLYYALERVARRICDRFDERHNAIEERLDRIEAIVQALAEDDRGHRSAVLAELDRVREVKHTGAKRLKVIEDRLGALSDAFIEEGAPVRR